MADPADDRGVHLGIWAGDSAVHAVAVDPDGLTVRVATASEPDPFEGIRSVLAQLSRTAGAPASVAFGVDSLLRAALHRQAAGPPAVALLQIRPRRPTEPAFSRLALTRARSMVRHHDFAAGGHDIFGTAMAPLDLAAVEQAARRWVASGITAVAVAAAGSIVTPDHEQAVAEYLSARFPEIAVWLSHECSGDGLLVRESVTVLQAVLAAEAIRIAARLDWLTGQVRAGFGGQVLTSDGGRITTERMRSVPLAAVGSDCAALLLGSGAKVGVGTLTVLAVADGLVRVGRLVDGLPEVAADLPISADVDPARVTTWAIVLPVDELESRRGAWSEALAGAVVAIVDDERGDRPADLTRVGRFVSACDPAQVVTLADAQVLRAVGVAVCEPVIRVQRLAIAATQEQLTGEVSKTADRAFSLLAASGGAPGTERIAEVRTSAVKYLLGDTYRLQVRAAARSLGEQPRRDTA